MELIILGPVELQVSQIPQITTLMKRYDVTFDESQHFCRIHARGRLNEIMYQCAHYKLILPDEPQSAKMHEFVVKVSQLGGVHIGICPECQKRLLAG